MSRIKKILYRKNPHQKEFHEDVHSKFLHLSSGFGGGKSFALVMKLFKLSALNKDIHGGLVCPSYTDFKKDMLPLFEDICDQNKINYKYHGTDHYFNFPWTKGRLYVATAEKKLRGPNWGFAGINEVTLMPHERFKEVVGRVRVRNAKCSQIAMVGTPEGTGHWLYEHMIEKPMANSRVVYGDTRDNQDNLDPFYIQSLMDSYDQIMLDAYLRGLWVNMSSNRFYYSYDPAKNDNKDIEEIQGLPVHVSLDFNVSKMVATVWHFDGKKLKAFDQVIIQDADTYKMCKALKSRGYGPDRAVIYPDPAGNARNTKGIPDIKILRQEGFNDVKVKTSAPRMRKRQLNMNALLDKGVIQLHPVKCKDLKKDFESVTQDPITLEKIKKDMERTHASDGADYMCDILFPFMGDKPKSSGVETIR